MLHIKSMQSWDSCGVPYGIYWSMGMCGRVNDGERMSVFSDSRCASVWLTEGLAVRSSLSSFSCSTSFIMPCASSTRPSEPSSSICTATGKSYGEPKQMLAPAVSAPVVLGLHVFHLSLFCKHACTLDLLEVLISWAYLLLVIQRIFITPISTRCAWSGDR